MIKFLKRMIAGQELAELERYRDALDLAKREMAAFSEVCAVLDHVDALAAGYPDYGVAAKLRVQFRRIYYMAFMGSRIPDCERDPRGEGLPHGDGRGQV